MTHLFLQRAHPHVFLPINVSAAVENPRLPKLAVVDASDADAFPKLHEEVWRTSKPGTVFRQFMLRGQQDDKGRRLRVSEGLVHRLRGLAPYSPSYALNGDPLDCRKDNTALAPNCPTARGHASLYKPGSVVATLQGYSEALNELRVNAEFYDSMLNRKRTTKLSNEKTLELLNAVLKGPMMGQTIDSISGYVQEELGVTLHVNQIRAMLKGTCLPQFGFDYKALAATRPSPRERALERWKQRQLEARP